MNIMQKYISRKDSHIFAIYCNTEQKTNDKNNELFAKYAELMKTRPDVIFGGRLGQYRYYDMDKVIRAALDTIKDVL